MEHKIETLLPEEIEQKSFRMISQELLEREIRIPKDQEPITKRVIHTSADFDYAETMTYSRQAPDVAVGLLLKGADIVTDTNMALAGINKRVLAQLGGQAHCFMADEDVARKAKEEGTTRAAVSMEKAKGIQKPVIFAIGNAPTALLRLHQMIETGEYFPAFIIGVPVGFVNVEAAKERIMETTVPYIVNRGRKGGSTIAAAICNALLYQARNAQCGFTTGSCAAAAAKAAAYMLLTGKQMEEIIIETPKGIPYTTRLSDIRRQEMSVSCAVKKDGGADPDITSGMLIYAEVSRNLGSSMAEGDQEAGDNRIIIEGGTGIGRVTRPGLDQPVGNAAINGVPRQMIQQEVRQICRLTDYSGDLKVLISAPQGERVAAQTYNPKLGIVGGISILGTSGIVEPMSSQAILDTIEVELRQRRAEGYDSVVVSPGNYGADFMKKTYGYDLNKSVKCSNFIGNTVDMAADMGFKRLFLAGHVGKLIKIAGGIMNTHSKEADSRMELLAAFAIREGVSPELTRRILECATTEEAVHILADSGKLKPVMEYGVQRICYYLEKRGKEKLKIDCILYTNQLGELAKSKGAETWFTLWEQEAERRT